MSTFLTKPIQFDSSFALAVPAVASALASSAISIPYAKGGVFGFEVALFYRLQRLVTNGAMQFQPVKAVADRLSPSLSSLLSTTLKILQLGLSIGITVSISAPLAPYHILIMAGTTIASMIAFDILFESKENKTEIESKTKETDEMLSIINGTKFDKISFTTNKEMSKFSFPKSLLKQMPEGQYYILSTLTSRINPESYNDKCFSEFLKNSTSPFLLVALFVYDTTYMASITDKITHEGQEVKVCALIHIPEMTSEINKKNEELLAKFKKSIGY